MRSTRHILAFTALLLLGVQSPFARADEITALGLYDAVDGVAMPRWTARWWQWAASMDQKRSPVADRTGDLCAVGQEGDVWFLAGAFGVDRVIRYCTVPAGKHLFFPLFNLVQTVNPGFDANCDRMHERVSVRRTDGLKLWVEVDGQDLSAQATLQLASPGCFDISARATPERGLSGVYISATNGFWAMLSPLSAGEHNIRFGAQRRNEEAPDDPYAGVIQDIEYVLTVTAD
ncbi:MAG: hypothetical protein AAF004_13215 [Pseudomonadota bacterium]